MALTNPKAAIMNAKEMIDARFVTELDDRGSMKGCTENKFANLSSKLFRASAEYAKLNYSE